MGGFTMGIVDIAPWIVLAASICGLAFAMYKFFWVKKQPEGTKEMANISAKIRKGAMAYLKRQYKTVGICIRRIFLRTFRIYRNEDCYIC